MKKIKTLVILFLCSLLIMETSASAASWYFMKNSSHKTPYGPMSVKKLKQYDAFYVKKTSEKVIYLTFDCGYEAGYTKKILKILKKHNAKATFFVTKTYVKSSISLCKMMKAQGHMVGNHTVSHPDMTLLSKAKMEKEINDCKSYFETKTGYTMDSYLRPPMGKYNKKTLTVIKNLGYKTIFWSMGYLDYDQKHQPGTNYVIRFFKKYVHPGAIPLIHAVSSSNTNALDQVLTNLEKSGYRFGTLDEL